MLTSKGQVRVPAATDDAAGNADVAEYRYDGRGRRIVAEVYVSGTLDHTRHFYYHGHSIVEERVDGTASGDMDIQYVWGLRYVDELIARHDGTNWLYALQDANYRVTAIVDDTGAVEERYSYTAYGERTVLNANWSVHNEPHEGSFNFRIGHQGLRHDESGLVYNRARILHVTVGRFVQRDPLNQNQPGGGYHDGMNAYQLIGSNPFTYADPSGLDFIAVASRAISISGYGHYSLEYWKSQCPGPTDWPTVTDWMAEQEDADIRVSREEAVELLNEIEYRVWAKIRDRQAHRDPPQYVVRDVPATTGDSKLSQAAGKLRGIPGIDGVSIVYRWTDGEYGRSSKDYDDKRNLKTIADSRSRSSRYSDSDIAAKWQEIILEAKFYQWGQYSASSSPSRHHEPPGNIHKWPEAKYSSFGRNSNFFVRHVAATVGLTAPEYRPHNREHPPDRRGFPNANPIPEHWLSNPWHPGTGTPPPKPDLE